MDLCRANIWRRECSRFHILKRTIHGRVVSTATVLEATRPTERVLRNSTCNGTQYKGCGYMKDAEGA